MSERNGSTSVSTGTAEIPVVRPGGPPAADAPPPPPRAESATAASTPVETRPDDRGAHEQRSDEQRSDEDAVPGLQPTAPVSVRPRPRLPRRGPLTVMGPWAPVAGGLLGLVLGAVAVLVLAGAAGSFADRLALVFVVLGLGMLGSAGILLADEVRMMRQRARDAVVRPQWVEATAGLLNGLTPARLLLLSSGFVLFLAAYVSG